MNYIELFCVYWAVAFLVTGHVWISAFFSSVCISLENKSSALEIKIVLIFSGIRKYRSIVKRKKKKHDKMVLLEKANVIE